LLFHYVKLSAAPCFPTRPVSVDRAIPSREP
jgi:hypothetical protein